MHLAKLALDEAIAVLRAQGHREATLVQSDEGSDFTSDPFHQGWLKYGSWVRCQVSQPGGTGILERLNRTYTIGSPLTARKIACCMQSSPTWVITFADVLHSIPYRSQRTTTTDLGQGGDAFL